MSIDRGYRPSSALQAASSVYHTSPLSNPWWARVREWRRVTFQTERGVRIKVDRDYRAADTKASFRTQEKNLSTIVSTSNMNT